MTLIVTTPAELEGDGLFELEGVGLLGVAPPPVE
jgi:hypothetical protein